jgi:hypothetical protein
MALLIHLMHLDLAHLVKDLIEHGDAADHHHPVVHLMNHLTLSDDHMPIPDPNLQARQDQDLLGGRRVVGNLHQSMKG